MYKHLIGSRGFTLIEVVLAIAVGLIIIAGVSVGYNYAKRAAISDNQNTSPTNSTSTATTTKVTTTTSLQTYRNDKLGFEFQYSPLVEVTNVAESSNGKAVLDNNIPVLLGFDICSVDGCGMPSPLDTLSFAVVNTSSTDVTKLQGNPLKGMPQCSAPTTEEISNYAPKNIERTITVGGEPALQEIEYYTKGLSPQEPTFYSCNLVKVIHAGKLIVFNIAGNFPSVETDSYGNPISYVSSKSIVDTIISTFRFTTQVPTSTVVTVSPKPDSCSLINNASFTSVNQEPSQAFSPSPVPPIYLRLTLKNGKFTWERQSDIPEGGSYICKDNVLQITSSNSTGLFTAYYDANRQILNWYGGVEYRKDK